MDDAVTKARVGWATAVGIAGALLLVVVVGWIGMRSVTSDRGIEVPPDAAVPVFSSMDDAVAYYEEERAALLVFATGAFGPGPGNPATAMIVRLDEAVADERRDLFPDPTLISRAAFLLEAMRIDGQRELSQPELHYAATPERMVNLSGTDAEAALDRVSGGSADLVIDPWDDPVCPEALACVAGDSAVHITESQSLLSDAQFERIQATTWESVMLHEFAHIVQRRWWAELAGSPDFRRLFVDIHVPTEFDATLDYPIEHSADCMALAVDTDYSLSYPGECTAAQIAFARSVWDGSFRF